MKKKTIWIAVLLVVLAVASVVAYRVYARSKASTAASVQTATVELGSLSSTLSSSGNTRSGQSATINWQTSGQVGEVTLKPGDLVQKDQQLAALDTSSLSTDMIKARQDLIDAQQTLDDLLNSKIQQAKALQAVEDAQKTLDTLKQTAAEQRSQAQLALAEAQQALKDAQKTRNKMDYPHSMDKLVIEKAQTEYLLAKQAVKEAQKEYNKFVNKPLTRPERVRALNNLVSAEQNLATKLATYNWYLMNYTDLDIAQADADLAVAQANLDSAQAEWDRLMDGASPAEIAMAEATLADAQREWERVKNGPSEQDIASAQAAVDAAQASLDHARLLAPFAGTVTEVNVNTGDLVSSGDAAFRIDDLASLYVDLQISEVDLASLKVGQPATLEFDAVPDKQYTGEVTEIGMVGAVSQGVVNYPVVVRITAADGAIRPGMTASVSIITDQVADALLVPNKAIRTTSGQRTVTVLFEGQQITLPVTVGLVGDTQTQVISDQLREGDAVVVNGATASSSSALNGAGGGDRIFFEGPVGVPPAGMP